MDTTEPIAIETIGKTQFFVHGPEAILSGGYRFTVHVDGIRDYHRTQFRATAQGILAILDDAVQAERDLALDAIVGKGTAEILDILNRSPLRDADRARLLRARLDRR